MVALLKADVHERGRRRIPQRVVQQRRHGVHQRLHHATDHHAVGLGGAHAQIVTHTPDGAADHIGHRLLRPAPTGKSTADDHIGLRLPDHLLHTVIDADERLVDRVIAMLAQRRADHLADVRAQAHHRGAEGAHGRAGHIAGRALRLIAYRLRLIAHGLLGLGDRLPGLCLDLALALLRSLGPEQAQIFGKVLDGLPDQRSDIGLLESGRTLGPGDRHTRTPNRFGDRRKRLAHKLFEQLLPASHLCGQLIGALALGADAHRRITRCRHRDHK